MAPKPESNGNLLTATTEFRRSDFEPRAPAANASKIITIPQLSPILPAALDEFSGHAFDLLKHSTLAFAIW